MLKETFINNEKLISEQTLMCLFRSILEPVLDNNIQSKIILNIDNTLLFSDIIERLKFSHKDYAINEQKYNLPENYNYLLILTENENSLLIWEKNETKYKYSLNINNKFINEFTQKLNIKTNNTNNSSDFYINNARNVNKFVEEIFPIIQLSKIERANEVYFCGSNNELHCDAQIKKNNAEIIHIECTTSMRQYFYSKIQQHVKIYKGACFGPHSKVRNVNDKNISYGDTICLFCQ